MNHSNEHSIRTLQSLFATVKDLHEDAKRLRHEMHTAEMAFHEACKRESTLEERLSLAAKHEPLFKLWCAAIERRDTARLEFFEQRTRFTTHYMTEAGVPGFLATDNWRQMQEAFPELYES